jgi:hypothetical protein
MTRLICVHGLRLPRKKAAALSREVHTWAEALREGWRSEGLGRAEKERFPAGAEPAGAGSGA